MKLKHPILILFIAAIIVAIFICYIFRNKEPKETKFIQAKKKQDSFIKKRDSAIDNVVKYSNENAKKGNELIKKLPNEKIYIPDTTNNYKFDYIKNYGPNAK